MQKYQNHSSNPKWDAQRNLEGRTHYVDDDTLKYHKSRILNTRVTDNGLLFAIIESYAVDHNNSTRAFRPVIFDIFGNVIDRPKLEDGYKTSNKAISAMWDTLNDIDAIEVTRKGIEQAEKCHAREMDYIRDMLQEQAAA